MQKLSSGSVEHVKNDRKKTSVFLTNYVSGLPQVLSENTIGEISEMGSLLKFLHRYILAQIYLCPVGSLKQKQGLIDKMKDQIYYTVICVFKCKISSIGNDNYWWINLGNASRKLTILFASQKTPYHF